MVTTTHDARTFAMEGKTPIPSTSILSNAQLVVEVMMALIPYRKN